MTYAYKGSQQPVIPGLPPRDLTDDEYARACERFPEEMVASVYVKAQAATKKKAAKRDEADAAGQED